MMITYLRREVREWCYRGRPGQRCLPFWATQCRVRSAPLPRAQRFADRETHTGQAPRRKHENIRGISFSPTPHHCILGWRRQNPTAHSQGMEEDEKRHSLPMRTVGTFEIQHTFDRVFVDEQIGQDFQRVHLAIEQVLPDVELFLKFQGQTLRHLTWDANRRSNQGNIQFFVAFLGLGSKCPGRYSCRWIQGTCKSQRGSLQCRFRLYVDNWSKHLQMRPEKKILGSILIPTSKTLMWWGTHSLAMNSRIRFTWPAWIWFKTGS